ncbi:Down-regulator of transcription 1 [Phytophthora pseudosyringae]|uniref:Down-regulator of transcription 1 n=1 Tax=Phytophthora pseudosyringae TaxID=221518 RepID=A0A8T1WN62_9STRA|nr:Down-regulator of transcription 1 [Phytophthora pseudosyringae]
MEWQTAQLIIVGKVMTALPKGAIEKLLREVVGDDVPISKETIDWVTECAGELLQVVGQEANTVAEGAAKKENYRISQEHVMAALENLGMQRYAQDITELQGSMELEAQVSKFITALSAAVWHAIQFWLMPLSLKKKKKKERIASRKAAAKTASRDELLAEQTALFKQASLKASREGW